MRRDAVLAWSLAAALAAVVLATTGIAATRAYLWAPYSDPHGWLAALFDAERQGVPWRVVWRPFNQQRIPLALLAQWADVEAVRARAPTFLLLGALAELTGLAAVVALIARSRLSARRSAALAGAAAVLVGGIAWAEDLAFPVFGVYPVVAGFAAAAFAALAATSRRGWGGPALAAVIAAGALASCGNAAGLAVWPVALFWAAVERRDPRQQAVLWIAAVVVVGVLEWGLGLPVGASSSHGAPLAARLFKMAQYLAGFAGLWWGAVAKPVAGRVLGLLVLFAATVGLLRRPGPGPEGAIERLGRLLASFGLATALLATLGRVDELPEPIVPTRYAPFAALLQLGALLCWSRPLAAVAHMRPRVAGALATLVVVCASWSQLKGSAALVATSRRIAAASHAFDAGDRSPGVVGLVDVHPEMDAAVRAELHRRGLPW